MEQTNAYMEILKADPLFKGIIFKIDEVEGHAKPELVQLRLEDDINPHEITGLHLSPEGFMVEMQREDTVVLDVRNTYEYDLGHFRGAIRPEVGNYRDTPNWVRENKHLFEGKNDFVTRTRGTSACTFRNNMGLAKIPGYSRIYVSVASIENPKMIKLINRHSY